MLKNKPMPELKTANKKHFTMKDVAAELRFAADVMRRLPQVKVQGYHNTWPPILYDFYELATGMPRVKIIPPSPAEITKMEEIVFEWLKILDAEETKLVWARAEKVRWKVLCYKYKVNRSTLWQRYNFALAKITGWLNKAR